MSKICNVVGCQRNIKTAGLCAMHYARLRRHGSVGPVKPYRSDLTKCHLPEHYSYNAMKTRCTYKYHKQYKDYGGRGIKVCDRWLDKLSGFANFIEDMGPRPDGFTLDRIDVNGDYCPENCRWASKKEQANNHRPRTMVTYHGKEYSIPELAQKNNLPPYVLYNRIMKYSWKIERAVTTPVRKNKR